MNRSKHMLTLFLGLVLAVSHVYAEPVRPRVFVSHFENVLGTSFEIKVSAVSEKAADAAEAAALAEIARLNSILSGYDTKTEFSRWTKTNGQPVAVSKELFEVLALFDKWRTQTGGALNASAETVNRLWKKASQSGRLPSREELGNAVLSAGKQHWILDAAAQSASRVSSAPLALNSFTKSYIIQRAADAAMAVADVKGVAVNIGGDIVLQGELSEPVLITDPLANAENDPPLTTIITGNKAIATSGNYRRGVEIDGKWYSHIVDPRTGEPVSEIISATVVAPDATDAGALATAFNVLTTKESRQLAASVPGAEYLIVTRKGERITSKGWTDMEQPAPASVPSGNAADWNSSYELAINFEIALIEGTRVRRPFIAVWVEDEKGQPVRNINVWYNRERWLPDLKQWYRHYFKEFSAEGNPLKNSVSSATRSPGKYTMKWDGKDDKGEPAAPGKYTVVIEVVREHGTYHLMKQEIEIKKRPSEKTYTLPGNIEIASASIELKKRAGK